LTSKRHCVSAPCALAADNEKTAAIASA